MENTKLTVGREGVRTSTHMWMHLPDGVVAHGETGNEVTSDTISEMFFGEALVVRDGRSVRHRDKLGGQAHKVWLKSARSCFSVAVKATINGDLCTCKWTTDFGSSPQDKFVPTRERWKTQIPPLSVEFFVPVGRHKVDI